jgi:CheY-like chemotaxis protein
MQVKVTIEDSGPGIPREIGNALFERFYQVQKTKTPSKPGFGIGLYLVKHFVEKHHGHVSYQSEPGSGTAFTIVLNKGASHFGNEDIGKDSTERGLLPELMTEENIEKIGNEKTEDLVHNKPSILVIEDEEEIRQYVTRIFAHDFIVYEANSGERGLQMAQEFLPDIIVSDVMMQNGTGIELCNAIKANPSLSHIPVILLHNQTI